MKVGARPPISPQAAKEIANETVARASARQFISTTQDRASSAAATCANVDYYLFATFANWYDGDHAHGAADCATIDR